MEKVEYEECKIEVIYFNSNDVITDSEFDSGWDE